MKKLTLLFILIIGFAVSAFADIPVWVKTKMFFYNRLHTRYYVDVVGGDDGDPGTLALPWATTHDGTALTDKQQIFYLYDGVWSLYRENNMVVEQGDLPIDQVDSHFEIF